MATVYSGNYSTGDYTYTRVKVEYSGTSATAILLYSRTNTYSGATYSSGTFTFGGASVGFNKTFYGRQTDAEVARVTFGISTSGGTYSGNASGSGGHLNFSGSVTIPAQQTKPSGQYIEGLASSWNGTYNEPQVTWTKAGVTSTGGGLSELYIVAGNEPYKSGIARLTRNFTNGSAGAISNNQNDWGSTKIDMAPNKQIYIGMRASNSAGADYWNYGTIVTVPGKLTGGSYDSVTGDSARVSVTTTADSGYYAKTIQYSIDGGTTWADGTTSSATSATTVSFDITGLSGGTEYSVQTRVSTTAGTNTGPTITFTTLKVAKLYGSVNGQTKEIKKLYGSVNVQTKEITKLYGSVNGVTKRIY